MEVICKKCGMKKKLECSNCKITNMEKLKADIKHVEIQIKKHNGNIKFIHQKTYFLSN
jgi:hypothetical protein